MKLGDEFPNFKASTSSGDIQFYDWQGDSWCILFSHPADFTPVCTTELSRVEYLMPEFEKRKIKVIALSCDSVDTHKDWIKDIQHFGKTGDKEFPFPIIADESRELATQFGMIDPLEVNSTGLPLTARAVFIIDGKHRLRLSILYPATTGRNFTEILRAIDSLQVTEKFRVATPADWKRGDYCMIQPSVKEEELEDLFPTGVEAVPVPSGRCYLRMTPQPRGYYDEI